MTALEAASFACVWLLIAISTSSRHWTLIATSQLVGNAVSSTVPGGGAAGGPLQYSYMVRGGEDPERVVSGLATTTLLSLTTLFGLAALCVPVMLWIGNIDRRLERAAWLGSGVFVIMLVLGALAFTRDGVLRVTARFVQNASQSRRARDAPRSTAGRTTYRDRVLEQRDRIRDVLGAKWPWALLAVVSKFAFDFFAPGCGRRRDRCTRVQTVPVLLAYVAASVLAMIPITPGGVGFVEAGLAVTLVWAGVPAGNATVATLAYRLVSYWLPLVAGVAAAVVYKARYPESSLRRESSTETSG